MKIHHTYKPKYGKKNHPVSGAKVVVGVNFEMIEKQLKWLSYGLIDKLVYTFDEYKEMFKKIKGLK
jgi:hypothetical protein